MLKNISSKLSPRHLAATATSAALGTAMLTGAASAGDMDKKAFDAKVMATVEQCAAIAQSCSANMQEAEAVLVFPEVIEANLLVGGTGGKGALVENGKITGYYKIGGASAGLQAGIDGSSQVYAIGNKMTVNNLKNGGEWNLGGKADITIINEDASAQTNQDGTVAYIFDSEGLEGGISLDVLRVWEAKS